MLVRPVSSRNTSSQTMGRSSPKDRFRLRQLLVVVKFNMHLKSRWVRINSNHKAVSLMVRRMLRHSAGSPLPTDQTTYFKHPAIRIGRTLPVFGLTSLILCACSWNPINNISSLSPAVREGALGYNGAVGDAADQILVANILRSKDFAPLNLSQLSSISGALSLQGSLGFTLPFGAPGHSGGQESSGQDSAAPSISGGTTPTYTLTPLNTQGFTLTTLQPIFANYVLDLLQNGFPREILFSIFIKEIDFPAHDGDPGPYRYVNDPDDQGQFLAFEDMVIALVQDKVALKTVDVLEPVGPEFGMYAVPSNRSKATTTYIGKDGKPLPYTPPTPPVSYGQVVDTVPDQIKNVDQAGFGLVTGASDAQYHVGNADSNRSQLYRVYPGQIVMCVDHSTIGGNKVPVISPFSDKTSKGEPNPRAPTALQTHSAPFLQLALASEAGVQSDATSGGTFDLAAVAAPFALPAPSSGTGTGSSGSTSTPSASSPGGGSKGGGGSPAASSTPSQATIPALQASRISALVTDDGCQHDQVILKDFSDDHFSEKSSQFVHVYWRSVTEVFQYLGAILRYNDGPGQGKAFAVPISPDPMVARATIPADSSQTANLQCAIILPKDYKPASDPSKTSNGPCAKLFEVREGGLGSLRVSYNERYYAVADIDPHSPKADYTRPLLSVMSTLVNLASQPSSIQPSTPLRLLPLP